MIKERTLKFNVSRDNEAKKAKEFEEVEIKVLFPEGCENQVYSDALAHMTVKLQQQIRSNWSQFVENGVPEEIKYGDPLYASRRTITRAPTEADINAHIGQLNEAGLQHLVSSGQMPIKSQNPELFK